MNQANYSKIGFFVLLTTGLAMLAIGVAGARIFKKKPILVETYFAESITGLDVGSPVKYLGVPIGEVKRIGLVYSEYGVGSCDNSHSPEERQILVIMGLDAERFGLLCAYQPDVTLAKLVTQGLRTKLTMSGVTGLSYVELVYLRPGQLEHEEKEDIVWQPYHPFVPSTVSTMATIKQALDDLYVKLSQMDLPELGREMQRTLQMTREKLEPLHLGPMSREITALVQEVRDSNQVLQDTLKRPEWSALPQDLAAAVASARRSTQSVEEEIPGIVSSTSNLLVRATTVLDSVDTLVIENSESVKESVVALRLASQTLNRAALTQQGSLEELVGGLRRAADSLDRLVTELADNPAVLLFGRPPEPVR